MALGRIGRGVVVQQDDTLIESTLRVQHQLNAMEWEVVRHTVYSQTYCHVVFTFCVPKESPQRLYVHVKQNYAGGCGQVLHAAAKELFVDGTCWLVHQWDCCLNVCGDFL